MINCTEVERRVLPAGVIIDVGDAEGLDGDGSDTQQQLPHQQQGVNDVGGGTLLLAAALTGRRLGGAAL